MSRRAYHEYKPSRSQCLDQVPEHWDERRLKFLISQKVTDGPHETPEFITEGVPFLSVDGIQDDRLVFEGCRFISTEKHAHYKVKCFPRKGDILLGKAASVGKVAIVDIDFEFGVWSPLALIRANESVLPKWVYYSIKAKTLQDQILNLSTSNTQHNLSMDDIPELWLTFPDVEEQSTILDFLDRETVKIDALVAKEERLVELLQEKRTTLISHAVTKGLDPNAKMKDSGIEWLGEIPEHWNVKRSKFLFKNLDYRRIPLSAEQRSYMEKKYPYYGASGIIDSVEDYIFDGPLILVAEDGANLLSRSTPLAFIAEGKYWVNNHAHILKPLIGPLKYWEGVLQTYDYTPLISGAAQPKLTAENLGNIPIPVPPENEQYAISTFINQASDKVKGLITTITESIDKLREYRTALISAAVTGKIDVRQEVS